MYYEIQLCEIDSFTIKLNVNRTNCEEILITNFYLKYVLMLLSEISNNSESFTIKPSSSQNTMSPKKGVVHTLSL